MDKHRQEILDKIAKLLLLAENTTYEGEKEAARAKVAALLAEYGLTLSAVRREQRIVIRTIDLNTKRINDDYWHLHDRIAEFSGCYLILKRMITRNRAYEVIGREIDINAAEYMIDVITRQVTDLYDKYKKIHRGKGRQHLNSYLHGLVEGVVAELNRITHDVLLYQQQEGLVPVNEMTVRKKESEDWYKTNNKVTMSSSKAQYTNDGYEDGLDDAKKINLRAPVASESSEILSIN